MVPDAEDPVMDMNRWARIRFDLAVCCGVSVALAYSQITSLRQDSGLRTSLAPTQASQMPPRPPSQAPEDLTFTSDVELVLLDVSVKDSRGGFVSGLTKNQFRVHESGREQVVKVFGTEELPVTIGLVVDNSGSMRPKRREVVTSALEFVRASNPNDEFFVVNFSDRVSFGLPSGVPFTDDRELLRQALLENPAEGRTTLYDGIRTALTHLKEGHHQRKALIVISDGGDNASETTRVQLMRSAEESHTTIYTIGIYNPEDRETNPGFLRRLATLSGGEAYFPTSLTSLGEVSGKIAEDIRSRYTIGYVPFDTRLDGTIRKLRVVATAFNRDKLAVRTRTHYIASQISSPQKD
jgi:VWFA-related protein